MSSKMVLLPLNALDDYMLEGDFSVCRVCLLIENSPFGFLKTV